MHIHIRDYYQKKSDKMARKLGLTKEEQYIAETSLDCLCFFNPNINPSYFEGSKNTSELFNNDRELFGRFFGALVKEFDCLSVIDLHEIPKGKEFEQFPTFIDIAEFFYEKYMMTKS
ncbi:hypothetical protein IMZ31_22220 (plasmid) [Pontibacillus sp. ALD_SL1]|uniref:hypothetical protein n=1 Tax=Pontibacillus sp. ALD_SL1 TaxID=2777185 RepID=UPI001A95856E|nr:hypothetical protein [Pontibacillus sp. ALD_SL1]QST02171.1 hypothetical protein IMZ31_22220 [Pontibacillus sp. ALD_SL1]